MARIDDLRAWAKGSYPQEAATELLIRAFGGRFTGTGYGWMGRRDDGAPWVDFDAIPDNLGGLSGGERRFLLLTAALGGGTEVNLGSLLSLDRDLLDLVLAAIAHAAGSHEGVVVTEHPDGRASFDRVGTLYPWPAEARKFRVIEGG